MNKSNVARRTALSAGALTLAFAALNAAAQDSSGYLKDTRDAVVKNPYNLCWRTGYWSPAMAIAECDPDLVPKPQPPVAEAAPPLPPAPPAPPPAPLPTPVTEKVTLSADALFDFDKAVVRPDGKSKLDELAANLKGVNLDTIITVGHADRFGSESYNQKLSQRRAAAVKAYLVSKGVPEGRIYTEGKGKTQPVTKPGECKGPKSPKVVACLQPDRRVVVEVVGTRATPPKQ